MLMSERTLEHKLLTVIGWGMSDAWTLGRMYGAETQEELDLMSLDRHVVVTGGRVVLTEIGRENLDWLDEMEGRE